MDGNQTLIDEIEQFCQRAGIAESTFGRQVVNDGKFVGRPSGWTRRDNDHCVACATLYVRSLAGNRIVGDFPPGGLASGAGEGRRRGTKVASRR